MKHLLFGICSTMAVVGLSMPSHADNKLSLELGVNHSTYGEEAGPEFTYRAKVRHTGFPVYVFAGYETPEIKMLGQPLGDADILTFGFGVQQEWKKLTFFAEAGYGVVDFSTNTHIQEEIVYTKLVSDHNSRHRPTPVDPRNYLHSYEVDDAILGRVGFSYKLYPRLSINFAYKWMTSKEEYAIWDEVRRREEKGYWREDSTHKFDAFEVGISFAF